MQTENQPTIFLIEEDEETRRPLVSNLRSYGYRVAVAVDEEAAIEMVGGGIDAGLILVNLIKKSAEEVLRVGRRVREHANFDGLTPLVVMPEKYDEDVEGTNVNVAGNDWILYLGEDLDQLRNLVTRLLPVSGPPV